MAEKEVEVKKGRCPACGQDVLYKGKPPEVCPHCHVTLKRRVRILVAGTYRMTKVWEHIFLPAGRGKWV